jgi:RND family efflux transporter MFP subunit
MAKINVLISSRLIGTALLVSMLVSACRGGPSAMSQGPPAVPVKLQTIADSNVEDSSEFVGSLEAQKRVALQPEVEGRIVEIFVESGEKVTSGTPIVQLRPDKTQAQVGGAIADVEAAQSARNTATAQLKAAQADRERAAADVKLQTTNFQRTQTLVSEGAQSQQQLDQARNQRDTALAALKAAQENVNAAQTSLHEAEARLSRARADQSVANENLRETRVVAPIAGIVGDIPVKVGTYVTTSDTLTSIIQNQVFELNVAIPAERGDQLEVGLPVELMNAQNKPLATGRISFVSPEVNTTQQAILAKATFQNQGNLRDGQFVRARVIWNRSSGVLVPTTAITRIAGQPFVYVAEAAQSSQSGKPDQVARQRPVKLGSIQGNSYQVLSGVKEGDRVVVSGILNLSDGSPITVAQPVSEGQQAQPVQSE